MTQASRLLNFSKMATREFIPPQPRESLLAYALLAAGTLTTFTACDKDDTALVTLTPSTVVVEAPPDSVPRPVSLLSFGDPLPTGTGFTYPEEYQDCGEYYPDLWHPQRVGWYGASGNGERVVGIATAFVIEGSEPHPLNGKLDVFLPAFNFEGCYATSLFRFTEIDTGLIGRPQLMSRAFDPASFTRRSPWPGYSGVSYHWYMYGDQPLRRYWPDTTAAYAPGIIIDAIDRNRQIVTGRAAGRYIAVEGDYVEEPERWPDTLLLEEIRFQAYLHKQY